MGALVEINKFDPIYSTQHAGDPSGIKESIKKLPSSKNKILEMENKMAMKLFKPQTPSRKNEKFIYIEHANTEDYYKNGKTIHDFLYSSQSLDWPDEIGSAIFIAQDGLTLSDLERFDYLEVLMPIPLFSDDLIKYIEAMAQESVISKNIKINFKDGICERFWVAKILKQIDFTHNDSQNFFIARSAIENQRHKYRFSESAVNHIKSKKFKIWFDETS